MPPEWHAQLDGFCKNRGISKTDLIEAAVADYLERRTDVPEQKRKAHRWTEIDDIPFQL